jgi:hypothetical protein
LDDADGVVQFRVASGASGVRIEQNSGFVHAVADCPGVEFNATGAAAVDVVTTFNL